MELTWYGLVEPQPNGVIFCFNLSKEVPALGAGKVWHRGKEQGWRMWSGGSLSSLIPQSQSSTLCLPGHIPA